MRFWGCRPALGAAVWLWAMPSQASHEHLEVLEQRQWPHQHQHQHRHAHTSSRAERVGALFEPQVERRGGQCQFPTNAGLVAVTPNAQNAGWAQAPDMPCAPGTFCPYACPPGQLSAQWDPSATSYTYPQSMHGGLYCDSTGAVSKPFPNKPYCYGGEGTVQVINESGDVHAVCQTVLPGYEDMLIPTQVDGSAVTVAVPGMDYWASTAAHFYHNPPGVSTVEGCIWGDGSQPIGNWAPFVSGANMDAQGRTFVKIAWNPIYLQPDCAFRNTLPNWGIKIECPNGGCNGLPCSIDPSVNGINEVTSANQASGAGGGNFCVVTANSGVTANVVVFSVGGSGSSKNVVAQQSSSPAAPSPTPTPAPPPSSTSSAVQPPSSSAPASSSATSSTISSQSSWVGPIASNAPHILFENSNGTTSNTSSVLQLSATTTKGAATSVLLTPSAAATTSASAAPATSISSGWAGISAVLTIAAAWFL